MLASPWELFPKKHKPNRNSISTENPRFKQQNQCLDFRGPSSDLNAEWYDTVESLQKYYWVFRYPSPITVVGFQSSTLTKKHSSCFLQGSLVASGCLFKSHCISTLFLVLYGKFVVEVVEYPDMLLVVLDRADLSEHWVCCFRSDLFALFCVSAAP